MFIILCLSYPYAACSFFMVGVASGAGAVLGVGAASVGVGAAAFTVNTGENCGGPVFFDGFVFWRAFLPVAWSLRRRSCKAGEPLLILVDGDAAFLPPDVGRGIGSLSCDCCGCPRLAARLLSLKSCACRGCPMLATPSFGVIPKLWRARNPSVSVSLALWTPAQYF